MATAALGKGCDGDGGAVVSASIRFDYGDSNMKRATIAAFALAVLTVGYADVSLGGNFSCITNPPCPAALEAERERQRRAKELREEGRTPMGRACER